MHRPILLLGEAWGAEEETRRLPFVGASGRFLNMLLRDAGIAGGKWMEDPNGAKWVDWTASREVYVTNPFNLRPRPTNDISNLCGPRSEGLPGYPAVVPGKYLRKDLAPEIARMEREILNANPNIIIALGNTALLVLTREKLPITKNRGTLFLSKLLRADGTPFKILPTFHPANVIRPDGWANRPLVLADLTKARRHASSSDFTRPSRSIWIYPTIQDLHRFANIYLADRRIPVAIDIETARGTITEIGFSPSKSVALVVPFYSRQNASGNYWDSHSEEREAWLWVQKQLLRLERPVFQNGLYDLEYLLRTMSLKVPFAGEDTMLLAHSLQPEMKKGLGFLASVYTDEPAWKFMRHAETLKTEDE